MRDRIQKFYFYFALSSHVKKFPEDSLKRVYLLFELVWSNLYIVHLTSMKILRQTSTLAINELFFLIKGLSIFKK